MSKYQYIQFMLYKALIILSLYLPNYGQAQKAFECTGQIYALMEGSQELAILSINPSNNATEFKTFIPDLGINIQALGFRSIDNLLYGLDPIEHILYRIDANGMIETLGKMSLRSEYEYNAGDISPDGKYFVLIGSQNGRDAIYTQIDLADFSTFDIILNGSTYWTDIAFSPFDEIIYAYDAINRAPMAFDIANARVTPLVSLEQTEEFQAMFLNAFGDLFAYGTTASGVASAVFSLDKTDGNPRVVSSGGVKYVKNLASCPYSIGMNHSIEPQTAFPCDEIIYKYRIANASKVVHQNINMAIDLPLGMKLLDIKRNPFNGNKSENDNQIIFTNMTISKGIDSIELLMEVGNLAKGIHPNQASISGFPAHLGHTKLSDNPKTIIFDDATPLKINRVEEDSLFYDRFFCLGESVQLDGSEFGHNLRWNNGSTTPIQEVNIEGKYVLEVKNKCQSIFIQYDVAAASCPFTIELAHEIEPAEITPCSEILYRFIIENDAGVPHSNIFFEDFLPEGFTVIEFLSDPFGGNIREHLLPHQIRIDDMILPVGVDTFEILIEVGNIAPGIYKNQAMIEGFPVKVGPRRFSDDPNTLLNDSTSITILGTESDSLFLDVPLCADTELFLDASPYGKTFRWYNGSQKATLAINQTGTYPLTILDGCDSSYVFFEVFEAAAIQVEIPDPILKIHLGDSIQLQTEIYNEGDSLSIFWLDPLDTTLSCHNCISPFAKALRPINYQINVANEMCEDSLEVFLDIDNTRRIYAANIFTPNDDGINDFFYLQSPDFAKIKSFMIYDRWGNAVYNTMNAVINSSSNSWDGKSNGQPMKKGIYLWTAEIEFLDGAIEIFNGDIALME